MSENDDGMSKVTRIRTHLAGAKKAEKPSSGIFSSDGEELGDCPITPLGVTPHTCVYLNGFGHFVEIAKKSHNKLTLHGLFAPYEHYPNRHWPKGKDDDTGRPRDFNPDRAARSLIAAATRAGNWDGGMDRLRGVGAWAGEDGDLVLHLGNGLQIGSTREKCGRLGRWIYPMGRQRPAPHRVSQPADGEGPGQELMKLLTTWNWRDSELHPRLLLGWVAASYLCGALRWRPALWLGGPRGTGKSTLINLLGDVLARGSGCIVTQDASAAGVRTQLMFDSLPVLFDEAEPSEDNSRLNALIELARLSSSGGVVLRATQDHGTAAFTVRFIGLFASVMRPPLKAQDLSRIAFVELTKGGSGKPPEWTLGEAEELGQRLFRRMLDGWKRWPDLLNMWRDILLQKGMDGRGADQFGTLLAAADLALHDSIPDADSLDEWAHRVLDGTQADRAEEMPEWARCLQHMLTGLAPQWRSGELRTTGQLVAIAAGRKVMMTDEGEPCRPVAADRDAAQKVLATLGLRFVPTLNGKKQPIPADHLGNTVGHLAVANSHQALGQLFRGTHWQARSGTSGAWKGALEQTPGACTGGVMRFGGVSARCVLVPLEFALDDGMEHERD